MWGDLDKSPMIEMSDDEKIDFVAACILARHREAFLDLAKGHDREFFDSENRALAAADSQSGGMFI